MPSPSNPDTPVPDALPAALLRLDAKGRVQVATALARTWLGPAAGPGTDLRAALGLGPGPWPAEPLALPGGTRWVTLRAQGEWLALEDQGALVEARHALQRTQELLDLAQDFGRLGVWERDLKTLQGRWDRHVHKFWGLDPDAPAPHFDAATQQIVEADRDALAARFKGSLREPGVYAHRYRVRRLDGGITHLQSQWAVKPGADGRPERVVGIMIDDSEVVALERAQLELRSRTALAESIAGLVVWRYDLKTGLVDFNGEGWAALGMEPREGGITTADARAAIHPDDRPAFAAAADAALRGQASDLELRYARPGGGWRHMLTRRVPVLDDEGRPLALLGVALDITQRSTEAQRARLAAERFELATRTAGIGFWVREGDNERADWNAQMRALHGLGPADPVPTLREWIAAFVHPDEREEVHRRFIAWLKGEVPKVSHELRIVRTDGEVRHLVAHVQREVGGEVPVMLGLVVDVTERRLADLALRRADERAALAARGAGIGTWELDRRDGSVHWDAQMWRLRGRPPRATPPDVAELVAFVHPEDRAGAALRASQAEASDATMEHQFRVLWPDGTVRWLASRSTTLRDARGQVLRRIGVNWDVTAQREAEAERSAREAAQQASTAKSRFLARMSHELRTPLNAVLGFAQLMQLDDDPAQRGARLQHVRDAGQHLLSLIDDVLDLASLDTGDLRIEVQPVDLAEAVAQALPLLEPLRAQMDIAIETRGHGVNALADPLRLRQVLVNLLSNACKYNRRGGQVRIELADEGERALLAVEDNGRGMDETQLRGLFQPFNRLGIEREGIAGTGIGLTIVKALVERMDGSLAVRSAPGRGSRFEVRLPPAGAAAGPAERPVPAAIATAGLPDPARGLLYIEDNPTNALIVRELMQRRPDLRLRIAADGASGLAEARAAPPALLLLDMQLPDMDGLAVLAALRADARTAAVPVVAVSANALPEDIERALAAGVAAYWTKPLDMRAFAEAIDALFPPPARG